MIYTVTLNPAVDKTLQVDSFTLDAVNRAASCRTDPGGKGINVSKSIQALGGASRAYAILSGASGAFISAALEQMGIDCTAFSGEGETRTNTKIVDPTRNTFTDVNEPGSPVSADVLEQALASLESSVSPGDVVVLSGSLPAGAPASTYATWVERCREAGARVMLDADGEALRHGIGAKPYLAKPNDVELGRLVGRQLNSDEAVVDAARELIACGVENVVVSLGGDGAVMVTADGVLRARQPPVKVASTVGAGDSVVAALALAEERGLPAEEGIRLAMATGAATVMQPGTQPAPLEDVEALLGQVAVTAL